MQFRPTRTLAIIAVAAAFGVAVAILKGSESGLRDAMGNISAPWLLLPYFAGTMTRGWMRGALLGLLASLAALAGFYVAEAFVLDLGGHPVLTNLALALGAGRLYFAAGLVSGPVFGAIGAIRTRLRPLVTAAVVGLVLIGEPLAVFSWLSSQNIPSSSTGFVTAYPALWIGEMAAGLILATGVAVRARSRPIKP